MNTSDPICSYSSGDNGTDLKPLQDMLLAEPDLCRLGRQDTTCFLISIKEFYINIDYFKVVPSYDLIEELDSKASHNAGTLCFLVIIGMLAFYLSISLVQLLDAAFRGTACRYELLEYHETLAGQNLDI